MPGDAEVQPGLGWPLPARVQSPLPGESTGSGWAPVAGTISDVSRETKHVQGAE